MENPFTPDGACEGLITNVDIDVKKMSALVVGLSCVLSGGGDSLCAY